MSDLGEGGGWAQNDMAYSSNKQITMHRQIGTSEERMHRSASIKLLTFHSLQLKKTILELPVLLREGIVPRLRALLRRPGKEEGDALRSWEVCWRLISCERLGGGGWGAWESHLGQVQVGERRESDDTMRSMTCQMSRYQAPTLGWHHI